MNDLALLRGRCCYCRVRHPRWFGACRIAAHGVQIIWSRPGGAKAAAPVICVVDAHLERGERFWLEEKANMSVEVLISQCLLWGGLDLSLTGEIGWNDG